MLTPLNEMVLIRPKDEPEKTAGGIYLPEQARRKSQYGEVLASDWDRVKSGDTVIYSSNGAAEVHQNGESLFMVPKLQILAIV